MPACVRNKLRACALCARAPSCSVFHPSSCYPCPASCTSQRDPEGVPREPQDPFTHAFKVRRSRATAMSVLAYRHLMQIPADQYSTSGCDELKPRVFHLYPRNASGPEIFSGIQCAVGERGHHKQHQRGCRGPMVDLGNGRRRANTLAQPSPLTFIHTRPPARPPDIHGCNTRPPPTGQHSTCPRPQRVTTLIPLPMPAQRRTLRRFPPLSKL